MFNLRKMDAHRERVSYDKDCFTEFKMGNLQFPLKTKVVRKSEKLNNLNEKLFELTLIT